MWNYEKILKIYQNNGKLNNVCQKKKTEIQKINR